MPAYKDEKRGTWYVQFYYQDWTGERKKKLKRGFATKREASEFERDFLRTQAGDINMSFRAFSQVYLEDMRHRLKLSTYENKRFTIEKSLIPFFGERPMNAVTPADVRRWQNEVISSGYKPTYQRKLHVCLSSVFNHAVRYYGLKENPCAKAGTIGKLSADTMQFWTVEEYRIFEQAIRSNPRMHAAFQTLYYTGMRVGELLALESSDVDTDNGTVSVTKTYQRIKKQDIITTPKTPKSNRVIDIPPFLCAELKEYMGRLYDGDTRLFLCSKSALTSTLDSTAKKLGLKKIRLHDLRHSHASLLIELGFSPLLIAERLGHENIQTTLNTYSHLYPSKTAELIGKLESLDPLKDGKN